MKTLRARSRVGDDGVLTLNVPVGAEAAGTEVLVTVEALPIKVGDESSAQADWERFVNETSGSIDDPTFCRHEQGEYEQRELSL